MKYEEFRESMHRAIREARLTHGFIDTSESIDPVDMNREHRTYLGPDPASTSKAFHASAEVSWSWGSLDTARAATTEEDVITELYGREVKNGKTDRSLIRVDLKLKASVPYDVNIIVPDESARSRWAIAAMEKITRYFPTKTKKRRGYKVPIPMSWTGEPRMISICGPDGELLLDCVEIDACQMIEVPRQWDDSRRKSDPDPYDSMLDFWKRVARALKAWSESVRHLMPRPKDTSKLH